MNHNKSYPIWLAYYLVFIILLASCATGQGSAPTAMPPTLPIPTATVTLSPTEIALQMILLNPAPRGYMSMAYDIESNQVIMFGGTGQILLFGGQIGDQEFEYTWETWTYYFNTNMWTNVTSHP